ncbi:MAG: gamma-butyrobetaine hydroxylase-like domain-containing protein [Pseudomonas sp.]
MDAPVALRNRRQERQLQIEWANGAAVQLSHAHLRASCPCSACRAGRLGGRIALVDEAVQLVALHPQGYGVQLVFSDGHERGIYPWAYLHELQGLG